VAVAGMRWKAILLAERTQGCGGEGGTDGCVSGYWTDCC
jgi:hypothetical protein